MGRKRITTAIAKQLRQEVLVEAYEKVQMFLKAVKEGMPVGPMTLAKAKRQHRVIRNELLRRGYDHEDVDYEPELPDGLKTEIEQVRERGGGE